MPKRTPKNKFILAWVDNSGFELTGRYRDRLCQHPETHAVPEAKACVWGEVHPDLLRSLQTHIARESSDHVWMGFFELPNTNDVLAVARQMALKAAADCGAVS